MAIAREAVVAARQAGHKTGIEVCPSRANDAIKCDVIVNGLKPTLAYHPYKVEVGVGKTISIRKISPKKLHSY